MRRLKGIIPAVLLTMLLTLLSSVSYATELRLLPATTSATVGETVSLTLQVDSIANLAGFQFDFSFPAASLEVKKITMAPAFDHTVKGTFDNTLGHGLVAAYGTTVSGTNVTLATIEMTVKNSTPARVDFANQLLGTPGGDEIPTTNGSPDGALITAKLAATVTLQGLIRTYDGTPRPVTVTTDPLGLPATITYDGSAAAPVNVGRYQVIATVNTTEYAGTASGELQITAPHAYRIAGNPARYFPTLAAAYLNAADNDVIEIMTGPLSGDLTADRNITVYLTGGFDPFFVRTPSAFSSIEGTFSIKAGKVVMNGIRLLSPGSGADSTPPVVSLLTKPPLDTLTVSVEFTASDNRGVTGYLLSESATQPSLADPGWAATAPTSYTFATFGDKSLHAYARDAAGNIGSATTTFGLYAASQPLTVTIAANSSGTGSVGSTPTGITCASGSTSGCLIDFAYSPQGVELIALADTGSVFGGWTGACSGMGVCTVKMSNPAGVTATFVAAPYVRIGSTSYASLQDAYDKAKNGDEIKLLEGTLAAQISSLAATRDVSITISGGYDAAYSGIISETILPGQMILKSGTVAVRNIKLRP